MTDEIKFPLHTCEHMKKCCISLTTLETIVSCECPTVTPGMVEPKQLRENFYEKCELPSASDLKNTLLKFIDQNCKNCKFHEKVEKLKPESEPALTKEDRYYDDIHQIVVQLSYIASELKSLNARETVRDLERS